MKNQSSWEQSKFEWHRGRLRASRDRRVMGVGSRLIADRVADFYAKQIPLRCKGRLLDLGCGRVPLFHVYHPYVRDVTCVDWDRSLHGTQHLDIECDLSGLIPLPDNHFDTIILSDVLEHLPNPEQICSEICRMLRPGGHLLANVPFYYPLHEEPHDYFRYTEFALRHFLSLAQLKVEVVQSIGGPFDVIADISAKLACVVPFFGPLGASAIQAFVGAVRRLPFLRRTFDRLAAKFPLGYVVVAQKPVNAPVRISHFKIGKDRLRTGQIASTPAT